MGSVVVKLGSSIVARDRGEVRIEVLSRICDEVAELHRAGREPVIVTSGAIARGMGVMELPLRPRAIDELQAASAVGQGKLYQVYDELLRARPADREGAADVLRRERAHALPERAPDATPAARVAGRPGDQRERHHDD